MGKIYCHYKRKYVRSSDCASCDVECTDYDVKDELDRIDEIYEGCWIEQDEV